MDDPIELGPRLFIPEVVQQSTPRLKAACDSAAQETGNETVPSRSFEAEAVGLADEWSIVWAVTGRAANRRARDVRAFIAAIIGARAIPP